MEHLLLLIVRPSFIIKEVSVTNTIVKFVKIAVITVSVIIKIIVIIHIYIRTVSTTLVRSV